MNPEALDFWRRALQAHETASRLVTEDPDAAASRAYYAAFYAVSALFALQGKAFKKHRAIEAAVHRELVNSGTWAEDLGAAFSWLVRARNTGDYGRGMHVSTDEAQEAVDRAAHILQAVRESSPEPFPNEES